MTFSHFAPNNFFALLVECCVVGKPLSSGVMQHIKIEPISYRLTRKWPFLLTPNHFFVFICPVGLVGTQIKQNSSFRIQFCGKMRKNGVGAKMRKCHFRLNEYGSGLHEMYYTTLLDKGFRMTLLSTKKLSRAKWENVISGSTNMEAACTECTTQLY